MIRLLLYARMLACTLLGHPRGQIFTAGGFFCAGCAGDFERVNPTGPNSGGDV